MSILFEERPSDSPFIETVTRGRTVGDGSTIRPAECHWHMVLTRWQGSLRARVVGPWSDAGVVSYTDGAQILWIKFKLGVFMPHLPTREFKDCEMVLPEAAGRSFWLHGSAWQFPDYEEVETFIDRLRRQEVLDVDPVVDAVLQGRPPEVPSRTLRYRFLRATGLSHSHIRQIERAQRAAALLQQGKPILDTVFEAGYFDQPHLTRSLKQWIGHTPAQISQVHSPA